MYIGSRMDVYSEIWPWRVYFRWASKILISDFYFRVAQGRF